MAPNKATFSSSNSLGISGDFVGNVDGLSVVGVGSGVGTGAAVGAIEVR